MATAPPPTEFLEAASPENTPAPVPPPAVRRRWRALRISVRSLLFVILVTGCGMGAVTHIVRTGQVQKRAVAAVYQAGGWVLYSTDWDDGQVTSWWRLGYPRWFVDRVGADFCAHVVFINLHDRGTDRLLAQVGQLTRLKQLHRPGQGVTDAGLAHLGRLKKLQFLSLDHTQVTDAGLDHLKGLAELRWLKLTQTQVSDAGVRELHKSLPQLRVIR